MYCGVVCTLGLRFINTFFTYFCTNQFFILFAYLCCFILLSLYTVGFCKVIEYVEDEMCNLSSKSKRNKKQRNQQGRWKYHPQGIKRNKRVSGWSRRRNKARQDNFWGKHDLSRLELGQLPKVDRWES